MKSTRRPWYDRLVVITDIELGDSAVEFGRAL